MAPTIIRIIPTVPRSTPLARAVMANLRMAPTAIRKMLTPMPMSFTSFQRRCAPGGWLALTEVLPPLARGKPSPAAYRGGDNRQIGHEGVHLGVAGLVAGRPQDGRRVHGGQHQRPLTARPRAARPATPLGEPAPLLGHLETPTQQG